VKYFGEDTSNAGVFVVGVLIVNETIGVEGGHILSVHHDVSFNAEMVVSVIDGDSVLSANETLLSLIVHCTVDVVGRTLVLDVVEGVFADSVFQNEVIQTSVALTADSLNAIFRGRNQLANSLRIQKVLVNALGTDSGSEVDGAVGHFGGVDAVCSGLEFEGLVITVRTNILQFLVVDLAVGNDVVFVTESIVQKEFIFTNQTNILLIFVNEAILNVSLVAEIGLFLQVVPSAASQAGQFVIQITGHLVSHTVGNLNQAFHSVIR